MECFVCFTYNSDSFLLWDVSIYCSIVSFSTFVFSIKFKKSVVCLRYDFCTLAIG